MARRRGCVANRSFSQPLDSPALLILLWSLRVGVDQTGRVWPRRLYVWGSARKAGATQGRTPVTHPLEELVTRSHGLGGRVGGPMGLAGAGALSFCSHTSGSALQTYCVYVAVESPRRQIADVRLQVRLPGRIPRQRSTHPRILSSSSAKAWEHSSSLVALRGALPRFSSHRALR